MSKKVFYEFNGDVKEIAKQIRKDLKEVFGKEFKFSVRIQRYSGGQSINIDIKQAPKYACYTDTEMYPDPRTYVKKYVTDQIRKITDHYNYDDSDIMTDYFNVGFYSHINDRIQ